MLPHVLFIQHDSNLVLLSYKGAIRWPDLVSLAGHEAVVHAGDAS